MIAARHPDHPEAVTAGRMAVYGRLLDRLDGKRLI